MTISLALAFLVFAGETDQHNKFSVPSESDLYIDENIILQGACVAALGICGNGLGGAVAIATTTLGPVAFIFAPLVLISTGILVVYGDIELLRFLGQKKTVSTTDWIGSAVGEIAFLFTAIGSFMFASYFWGPDGPLSSSMSVFTVVLVGGGLAAIVSTTSFVAASLIGYYYSKNEMHENGVKVRDKILYRNAF